MYNSEDEAEVNDAVFYTRRTHVNNSITEVSLLPEEDVGCAGDEAAYRHV